jgi:DNA (cytosine-5)-methyltransferase 1
MQLRLLQVLHKVMNTKITAIDFFCGAGGLTRGFLNAGITVKLGIEIDESCQFTYQINNQPAKMLVNDVRKITVNDIKRQISDVKSDELLLAACAPCQPFSQQRRKKRQYREKNLILQFGRFVKALKPKYIFIENVPGLKNVKGPSSFKRFLKLIANLDYEWQEKVINAKDYGVPQSRKRLVLIAVREFKPQIPKPTHGNDKNQKPYETVKSAIKDYPRIEAGSIDHKFNNHWAADITPINMKRMQATRKNGGSRLDWPTDLQLNCHLKVRKGGEKYRGHTDVYGRMRWNQPAPTLTCKCVSVSNVRYGHPNQNRAISLREAAKLQSFSDDYMFFGPSKGHLAQQVGNAVPVKLGEVFGKYFLSIHKNKAKK